MDLPSPDTHPELFEGILRRRSVAYLIDCVILTFITSVIVVMGAIGGIFTFGLFWVALPFALPIAVLVYYAATLGGPSRATVGMRMMDLVLTPTRGRPLDGWRILIHPILFWITVWIIWPFILVVVLFTPRRQTVHDLITGTLMLRRSPMEAHWRRIEVLPA